jgi:transcriptional regulator with XRE-family HTH domain
VPRLQEWRLKRAFTQEELYKRSKVSRTTIIKLEAGRNAWPSTVLKLAKALKVDPAELQ